MFNSLTKKQQWLITSLVAIVTFTAVVLVLQQGSNKNKTKVLGVSIDRSTTTSTSELQPSIPSTIELIPGLGAATTTTTNSTIDTVPVTQGTTATSSQTSNSTPQTTTVTVTSIVQPTVPQPPLGAATIKSLNVVTVDTSKGTVVSSTNNSDPQGNYAPFDISSSAPQGKTVYLTITITNKSDKTFTLDSSVLTINKFSGNTPTKWFDISLGSFKSIAPFQQVTLKNYAVTFPSTSTSVGASMKGTWH